MRLGVIAWLTFHEARRRRLLWAVGLMGLLFLGLFGVAFYFMYGEISKMPVVGRRAEVYNMLTLMGLYAVNFLVVMLTVLASVDILSGEIASGTIHTLLSRPIHRWEVVVGKWLGLAAMMAVFTVSMCWGLILISRAISGYYLPSPWLGVGLMVLEGTVVLSLSLLGGTRLSTLANGVIMFMLYGLAFIAGWVENIGSLIANEAAVNIGIAVSLLVPTEAMWRLAAYVMQPPLARGFANSPFATANSPSPVMVAWTVAYVVLAMVLAVVSFQRRDL